MTLAPLLQAGPAIQIHALTAMLAGILSLHQFTARAGGTAHRAVGYAWVGLMLATAFSSFFVQDLRVWGPFSPIHLLSVATLVFVPWAVIAARRHQIVRHRAIMRSLVFFALIGAGLFTLLPGRIMHQVVFGAG